MKKSLLLGLIVLLLAACGQTGPLYLPEGGGETAGEKSQSSTAE